MQQCPKMFCNFVQKVLAKNSYDTSDICKAYLNTLDTIIESGYLLQMIGTYFMSPEDTFNTNQDMIKSIYSTVLKDGMGENYPFDSVFMPDSDTLFTLTLRNILKHTKELYLSKQQQYKNTQ